MKSGLPPIRDIAEQLRDGYNFDDLCDAYDVKPSTLQSRLSIAGYGISGHTLRSESLQGRTVLTNPEGSYVAGGVWGGDYQGLPLEAVPHARRKKIFLGLDWSTSPATGPLWGWA